MKRSTLLYLTLSVALFASLAHLRADWLGRASAHADSGVVDSPERTLTSALRALHQSPGREATYSFVRQP